MPFLFPFVEGEGNMAAAGTSRLGRLCVVLCWLLTVTLTSAVEQLTAGKLLKFESLGFKETNKNKVCV